jgi:hypothetical protein
MLASGSGHCAHALLSHPLLPALDVSSLGPARPAVFPGRAAGACEAAAAPPPASPPLLRVQLASASPGDAAAPIALAHRGWCMHEKARCIQAGETSSDAPIGTCGRHSARQRRARLVSGRGTASPGHSAAAGARSVTARKRAGPCGSSAGRWAAAMGSSCPKTRCSYPAGSKRFSVQQGQAFSPPHGAGARARRRACRRGGGGGDCRGGCAPTKA